MPEFAKDMIEKFFSNLKFHKFHWSHMMAVIVLVGYFFISKMNLVHALRNENLFLSFLQIYVFGIFFACLFLYIFSHDKFFWIARQIEKEEKNKEEKYIKKYIHHGKILGTFLIGAIGGPIFSSLTARILLNNFRFKYLVIILANIPSTLFTLGVGWGILRFV